MINNLGSFIVISVTNDKANGLLVWIHDYCIEIHGCQSQKVNYGARKSIWGPRSSRQNAQWTLNQVPNWTPETSIRTLIWLSAQNNDYAVSLVLSSHPGMKRNLSKTPKWKYMYSHTACVLQPYSLLLSIRDLFPKVWLSQYELKLSSHAGRRILIKWLVDECHGPATRVW